MFVWLLRGGARAMFFVLVRGGVKAWTGPAGFRPALRNLAGRGFDACRAGLHSAPTGTYRGRAAAGTAAVLVAGSLCAVGGPGAASTEAEGDVTVPPAEASLAATVDGAQPPWKQSALEFKELAREVLKKDRLAPSATDTALRPAATAAAAAAAEAVVASEGRGRAECRSDEVHDVDRLMAENPYWRDEHALHDTLNGDNMILCPWVLKKGDKEGIAAVVWFGRATRGHPKVVHGGLTSLVFDDLFGTCLYMGECVSMDAVVVTAYLKVDYRAALPCETAVLVTSGVDKVEGRKIYLRAAMTNLDGTKLYAEASALFIVPRAEAEVAAAVFSATASTGK